MSLEVQSFGCRLNIVESAMMKALAQGQDNTIVINTCAVTNEAERQAAQAIRKAGRDNPGAKIIVTGCAAQLRPEHYAAMPEVSRVLGNHEKLLPETWQNDSPLLVNDIMSVRDTAPQLVTSFDSRARAFVQVQQGCDHRCTFCIIPFGRGNSRSVPLGQIVQQVRLLVEGGYNEVVLTGVDVTSYGHDLPGTPGFGEMVRRLLAAVPELPRLRLSSLDPVEIDAILIEELADNPRLMPHFHLSAQAGDNMILKRMKRRHQREDVLAVCARLRQARPGVVFGADFITGFPTETEEMFQQTLDLVQDAHLTWLHVFPYSARIGTPAAKMPQVPQAQRKERASRLRALGTAQEAAFYAARKGIPTTLVVEEGGHGRGEHFEKIPLGDRVVTPGTLCTGML